MANSASARKRARQSIKQRAHNMALRSTYRTSLKKARKAIETGNVSEATSAFRAAMSVVDRIADKKILHKNKAARHKSRLAAALKAVALKAA